MNAKKRTWVVPLTGIGSLLAALDTLVVASALSTIRVDLHASVAQLEWTVNACSLSFAVLLMTAAALGERRASEPMLPLGFFRSRAFSAGNAAIFCVFASLFSAVFFFAQQLQTGLGYDALDAGLRLLPWTGTFLVVAPIAGALADRIGERPLMVCGLLVQAGGMAWIALIAARPREPTA